MLCPAQLPLHEIYYYNHSANIRYNLNASPRGVIQRGLAAPHHYILVSVNGASCMRTEVNNNILKNDKNAITLLCRTRRSCLTRV